MEPLEAWLEAPLELRLSADPPRFAEEAATQAQRRGAGAAEVWQVISAPPEELVALRQRAGEDQRALKSLQEQLRQEKAAGLQARQELKRVASERFAAWTTYGLAGLLALALLALGWQVRSTRRRELEAWRRSVALNGGRLDEEKSGESMGTTAWPRTDEPDGPGAAAESGGEAVDADITAPLDVRAIDEAVQAYAQHAEPVAEYAPPVAFRAQDIEHPEDLFDVLQQAEFFVSIGEHEQAVEGLRRHIAQHANSSPLAYLELLRLYHTLGRASAFDGLRVGFEERFNARVPSFAVFQRGGKSLEDYEADVRRLESLWGSVDIVGELDRLMFRREGVASVDRFDLPAYEDLLLLLAIAQSGPGKGDGAASSSSSGKEFAAAPEVKPTPPSLDTLAGDLTLAPSQQMQIHQDPPVGEESAGNAPAPEIVAPDETPKHGEGSGVQLSLEPRDSGRRIVR